MGVSTDAILAYGYNLGGCDEWLVEEQDEDGLLALDWFTDDDDESFVDAAIVRLMEASGFVETDGLDSYRARIEAEKNLGVEFVRYCHIDYSGLILAAREIRVYRGDVKVIDPVALSRDPVEGGWDAKLNAALATLGLTPKQERPGWLLCSYWG